MKLIWIFPMAYRVAVDGAMTLKYAKCPSIQIQNDMGSILINYPDIPDSDLVFDEQETREILKFFWPAMSSEIDGLNVTNDTRRFAQTLLVAAVDASYAMGFIHGLAEVFVKRKPGTGLKVLVKKLAKKYVKHWWRHATQDDLLDAKIYESVREAIAVKNRHQMIERVEGIVRLDRRLLPSYAAVFSQAAWG